MFLTSVHVVGQWVSHGFSVTQSIKTLKKYFCPFNILFGTYWNFGNLISKSAKHRKRKLGDNRSYMLYANCDSNAAKLSFIWMRDSLAAFKCQFDFKLTSQEVMWRGLNLEIKTDTFACVAVPCTCTSKHVHVVENDIMTHQQNCTPRKWQTYTDKDCSYVHVIQTIIYCGLTDILPSWVSSL